MSNLTVILMGLGTVFFGLVCIVFLCYAMSFFCNFKKDDKNKNEKNPVKNQEKNQEIPNKGEFSAAVAAVIAEELGKDVSAIRITEIRKA